MSGRRLSHAGWISSLYQLVIRHWRVSHFEAMHRFPVAVAMRQARAIWEAEGLDLAGPTYAESYAARRAKAEMLKC